jgi:predicted TIM-barrel fold metal-dependent hydrolase
MVIDWEHHITSKELGFDARGGKEGQQLTWGTDDMGRGRALLREEMYRVDKHIEFMDKAGIDIAVISTFSDKLTIEYCKGMDDYYAKLMNDYPKRFVGLAPVDPTLGKDALNEIDRAIKGLGLRGICVSNTVNGNDRMDSQKLWPFYKKVQALDVPIFVHVSEPQGYEALYNAPYNLAVTLVREFSLAETTARIILSGVLTDFPDLKFVISHMGGGISAIKERLVRYIRVWDERFWAGDKKFWDGIGSGHPLKKPYAETFEKDFKKLYFDMAGFEGGMNAVKCALTTISPNQLLFGTDYYPNFTNEPDLAKRYIENIRNLNLSEIQIEGILGDTAARLLKI